MRLASPAGACRLSARDRVIRYGVPLVTLIASCLSSAACDRHAPVARDVRVEWTLRPSAPVAGTPTVAALTLRDSSHQVVRGATLRVEAHMSHPGMAPVMADVEERSDGTHQLRVRFTMAGDWILFVTGDLPDGRRVEQQLDVTSVRPGG